MMTDRDDGDDGRGEVIPIDEARRLEQAWAEGPMENGGVPGEAPGEEPEPLELVYPSAWQGQPIPDRRWLVTDWIPEGYVTGLYGDGGIGKSLLAQMLAASCALGRDWLGLPTKQARVLAVMCEDDGDELWRRQAAICDHYEHGLGDLELNLALLPRLGEDNILMDFAGGAPSRGALTPFYDQVLVAAKDIGAELTIIDTIADTFGGNENDRGQVRQYVNACLGRLARETSGSVLVLGHPSVAGMTSGTGTSGSTGWSNTFRSRLFLHAPEAEDGQVDRDARILSRKKANYAGEDQIELRWEDRVFKKVGQPGRDTVNRLAIRVLFLEVLADLDKRKVNVSANRHAPNYAPKVMRREPAVIKNTLRVRANDLENAMLKLIQDERIVVAQYGRPSDPRYRLEVVNSNTALAE